MIPPGPDPIQQGEKAFQAMGSFARVVPTIVFHGTADPVSDPINGDQVTQQWITTNHLASPADFTATFEHPSSTINHPAGPDGEQPYTVDTWQDAHGRDWSPITKSAEWAMPGPAVLPGASSRIHWGPTRARPCTSFSWPTRKKESKYNIPTDW